MEPNVPGQYRWDPLLPTLPGPNPPRRGNRGWWFAGVAAAVVLVLLVVIIGRLASATGPVAAVATSTPTPTGPGMTLYQQVVAHAPTLSDPLTSQDANDWEVTQPGGACYFANNLYYALQNVAGYRTQCRLLGHPFGDMALRVNMTMLSGDLAGVTFYVSPNDALNIGYRLEWDANGGWSLVASSGHTPTIIASGSASDFNTGYGQSNELMVIVTGGQINLYVNETFLAAVGVDAGEPASGLIGTYVYERSQLTQAAYSNLTIWDLS